MFDYKSLAEGVHVIHIFIEQSFDNYFPDIVNFDIKCFDEEAFIRLRKLSDKYGFYLGEISVSPQYYYDYEVSGEVVHYEDKRIYDVQCKCEMPIWRKLQKRIDKRTKIKAILE